jgi:long-chain acyl-CoA synthetase
MPVPDDKVISARDASPPQSMNDPQTPPLLDLGFGTLPTLIRGHAQRDPRHAALVHDGRTLTFGALDTLMDRVAAALQRDGIAPQDVIAICAGTSLDYAAVFLGALRAGVAVAPLAPSGTAQEIAAMATDAGARLLFLDAGVARALEPVAGRVAARRIALDDSAAGTPLRDWLAPPGATPAPVEIQPHWAFNLIYSSGTTGVPKGIVQSHAMRWGHVQRAAVYGYGPDTVTMLATPLYSNTTLVCFFPTLSAGGTAVLMGKFDAAGYLALAAAHGATHTMLVPVQYQRIMALPEFARHDLSSFRFKFCTSAPFRAELKADIVARWPGALLEFYGLTEGGGTCILAAHEHPSKLHTVGRPAEGHDVRLIDEQGREVAPGETGEVVGRSPIMMNGYHGQPEKTREAEWYSPDGLRFIRSGDLGRFDADGFLTLLDRRKDMIISGGFNVYPTDLEAVIRGHAEVADVAVVGVPSERWGETPVAFVVLRPGAGASAQALLDWTNARVNKIQRLADLRLVDALPRSAIGKVLKRQLRDTYRPAAHPR